MGISGLLPVLKEIQVHGNISEFKGKRLAVDAYVWLHKGAFGCAEDIVKGKKTTKFVDYAMYRVRLMRHHGIEPYIVFDGGPLPAKKKTEVSREKSRAENLARAQALEGQGRLRDARDLYTKCVDITPEMALQLIKALRAENVDYVVAPYEADAQLCFLEREGYVDGIITEDSDLLVFGCRHVIFKLEGNGQCVHIKAEKLALVNTFPMHGWTDVQFRRMAMLSGCDYLDSIPGVGLKTAHRLLRRHKTVEKVVQMIKLEGTLHVPVNYIESFAQAELAFIHQRVYDPTLKKLVPLNEFPEAGLKEDDEKWVGLDMAPEVARGIAEGNLHPETGVMLEDICPDYQPAKRDIQKMPIGAGSKAKVAGPLDAFISRSRAPKTKLLPTPVGQSGPGVSRLSDRNLNVAAKDDLPIGVTKKSKFFARKNGSPTKPVQLKWDSSQEPIPIDMDDDEPIVAESHRSPSNCASPKHAEVDESFNHLTSPAAPELSSPAVSSPPRGETFTSPRPDRDTFSRSITPISPTRPGTVAPSVLIPSTSQIVINRPQSSSAPNRMQRLGTSTYSNFDSSSDTIDIEEVVTPSFEVGRRTASNTSLGKRSRIKEEEEDEVELEERVVRAEKAKVIAHDWRLKYAFGANPSPMIRPARPNEMTRRVSAPKQNKKEVDMEKENSTPRPPIKSRASMPLSATMPRILNIQSTNIPATPAVPTPKMSGGTVLIPSSDLAAPSSSPGTGGLMKYRFTGKVDTRQMSSPRY